MGTSLSDLNIAQVIAYHIGLDLPIDTNGVYFLMTSADVTELEFCSNFCAFHGPSR